MSSSSDASSSTPLLAPAGAVLLAAVAAIKAAPEPAADAAPEADGDDDSDEDETGYRDPQDAIPAPEPAAPAAADPRIGVGTSGGKKAQKIAKNKKKDPLRIAAKSKSVAGLESSTVTSGYLWKVGGSGLKMKHWKRRFFVLTDDNCIYYFKSQKEMSALGMIMLPSYTITVLDKSDNVGNRPFAWKAFNRLRDGDRQFVFAAESQEEMKTWMNVMSLASIAFGTGKASMAKATGAVRLAGDQEMDGLMQNAPERGGGVTGGDEPIAAVTSGSSAQELPAHIQKSLAAGKQKGRTLALIRLLDGETLQLYAENNSMGEDFLNQVCLMLSAYERYYFGLAYVDKKGDEQWLAMDKKVMKHEFKKGQEHIELEFRIRFPPMDVTQVMQYVTLYQAFLAARRAVVTEELSCTGKDAMLLAALSLQALRGDYNPEVHSKATIDPVDIIPARTMREARIPANIAPPDMQQFWRDELIRCWAKMRGVLKHLAVLKYMQIVQKHRLYAMSFVDVKNKQGTPLSLGVSPHGLYVFRLNKLDHPVVKFSWAECSELSFTEKKFTIMVHDRNTKAFSVYCSRAKVCQRVLRTCVGLHQLYVQTVRNWASPPPELAAMRQQAITAALSERAKLQEEADEARVKVKAAAPAAAAPAAPAAPAGEPAAKDGDGVVIQGRNQAVQLMDMMMNDQDFMTMQDDMMRQMELEMGDGYDEIGDGMEPENEPTGRDRCASEAITDRVAYMESLAQSPEP